MRLYGLRKCSTCQKALDFIARSKTNFTFKDWAESPPSPEQVARWAKAVGGWEKLINRSGYTWRGLPKSATENITEDKAIALAVKHPSLIRRPLIEHGNGTVTVGFSAKVQALFEE